MAAIARMLEVGPPQALLLTGLPSVGKTTLALDLAAGLLCTAASAAERPCRACRSCRQVATGSHQDLHRLAPEGAGRQVRIGDPDDPDPGTVRHLLRELARRPVEGRVRVAVIEGAHRLNEDAQNALLKTLEEPPPDAVVILCADEPERLLPTVRSRAATVRLGPVDTRAIEELLGARGIEPAQAARLARMTGGRPGQAIALAGAPAAVSLRDEMARAILDLAGADRSHRLATARELLSRAAELARLDPAGTGSMSDSARMRAAPDVASTDAAPEPEPPARSERGTPAERRLAAGALLEAWAGVARDLAVAASGAVAAVRDPSLLEDLVAVASHLPAGSAAAFLPRLARAATLLDQNANPELLVDVLALAWPRAA